MKAKGRLIVFIFGGVALVIGIFFARSVILSGRFARQKFGHTLHILAYSSFVGSTGPGSQLVEMFEHDCRCRVEIATAGDAGLLLERLKLAQESNPFDLVIGLDQLTIADAKEALKWREIHLPKQLWSRSVQEHVSRFFIPFDWAPMTFIYRKGEIEPPHSLDELTDERFAGKIAIQDPRSSTAGLQLYQWIEDVKGAKAKEYLEALKPNIQSISPSWSFSYGLFRKGQAQLVFTYLTSLAYQWEQDPSRKYQAAVFSEGHPYQVEFAAIPAVCQECELAELFIKTMLSEDGQKFIFRHNYMLPAAAGVPLTKEFDELPKLTLIEAPKNKDLQTWLSVFHK